MLNVLKILNTNNNKLYVHNCYSEILSSSYFRQHGMTVQSHIELLNTSFKTHVTLFCLENIRVLYIFKHFFKLDRYQCQDPRSKRCMFVWIKLTWAVHEWALWIRALYFKLDKWSYFTICLYIHYNINIQQVKVYFFAINTLFNC